MTGSRFDLPGHVGTNGGEKGPQLFQLARGFNDYEVNRRNLSEQSVELSRSESGPTMRNERCVVAVFGRCCRAGSIRSRAVVAAPGQTLSTRTPASQDDCKGSRTPVALSARPQRQEPVQSGGDRCNVACPACRYGSLSLTHCTSYWSRFPNRKFLPPETSRTGGQN